MERQDVYKVIDSEREFQEKIKKEGRPDILPEMSMGDILHAIEFNLSKASTEWYTDFKPYKQTTKYLRKIAALCVLAGEQFGMEERK